MRKFVQGSYLAVSAVFLWGLFLLFNSSNICDWTLTLRLSLARSECRVPCSVSVLLIVDFTAFPPALFTAPWVVVSTETGLLGLELSWRTSQVWTSSMFLGGRIFFSSASYMIGNISIQLSLMISYQQKALVQTNGLSALQQYHIAEWCSFCPHITQPRHHPLCLFGTSNTLLSTSLNTLTVNSWVPAVKPTEAENWKPTAFPVPLRLGVSPVCILDLEK